MFKTSQLHYVKTYAFLRHYFKDVILALHEFQPTDLFSPDGSQMKKCTCNELIEVLTHHSSD